MKRQIRAAVIAGCLSVAAVVGATTTAPVIAQADPVSDPIVASGRLLADPVAPDGSKFVLSKMKIDGRKLWLRVYSEAMGREITVSVLRPKDASQPRPTLYLLNGADAGEGTANWINKAPDALDFLGEKDINVVQPIGGAWSYYTDWKAADPVLGLHKWKTFLTEELPPLIDTALGTNGVNAIAGLSTSGTSVLNLPIAKPGLYKAAAAYSGCAQTSDPIGREFIKLAVETWGGGNTENMYGPADDPMWVANDPLVHAEQLRGLELYISSGNGLPGQYDVLNGEYAMPGVEGLANQMIVGGVIEAATNYCSHNLVGKLGELGIPITADFPPSGTHSWGYWRDALIKSWPVLAKGLGLPA